MNSRDAAELRRASVRLALQFASMIIVLFALLITVTFVIVGASQSEATTRSLVDASLVDQPKDGPPGILLAMTSSDGLLVSPRAPSWFPVLDAMKSARGLDRAQQVSRVVDGERYVIRTSVVGGRVVQAAVDTREAAEELQRLTVGLIVSGLIATLAAAVVGALMARRVMRPMAAALALQRRFVTDASHELRMPLTLLSTRAQLLRRTLPEAAGGAEGPVAAGLEEIIEDSRDLTAILEDLLVASDPRETVPTEPTDVAELGRTTVAALRDEAAARGIDLAGDLPPTPVVVDGTRVSLQRLFTALIANALDHAREAVTVDVRAHRRDAEIRVGDDGPGFAPGMETRALQRFVSSRPDSEDTSRVRHYGLGLALVAEVAARHGGSVEIESRRPGTGAVIVVRLPLSREQDPTRVGAEKDLPSS